MSLIERAVERMEKSGESLGTEVPPVDVVESAGEEAASAEARQAPAAPDRADPDTEVSPPAEPRHIPSAPSPSIVHPIDIEGLAALGYLTPSSAEGPLVEEMRRIKRPLVNAEAAPSDRSNVILVTSSVPAEGKTFIAINLAMSICADVDRTVLLVDGDTRRSRVAARLGIKDSPGILDVIEGKCGLGDAIVRTDVPTLAVLPAGHPRLGAEELFASDQARRIIDEMASRYSDRVIIIDSPPLLAASETSVLARLAGCVVVVVRADTTSNQHLHEALNVLNGCDSVALVLNRATRFLGDPGHYYGYYGAESKRREQDVSDGES